MQAVLAILIAPATWTLLAPYWLWIQVGGGIADYLGQRRVKRRE